VRRTFAILRKPAAWLPLLFLAWAWFLRSEVVPRPDFSIRTEAVHREEPLAHHPSGTWCSLRSVSDDGSQVTVAIYQGDGRCPACRLDVFDTRTGARRTPALWQDAEWVRLLSAPVWRNAGLMDCLAQPSGKEFLTDQARWAALRRRLTAGRARALDDLRKTTRPVEDAEATSLFPEVCSFSPDGRRFAYVVRHGWPLYLVSEDLGDGTAVEDVRTGKRLAFLPGVTDLLRIAPGGRTAVCVNDRAGRPGEQPRLLLWDLVTSARRGLLLPEVNMPVRLEYSADGRYVFALYGRVAGHSLDLRWWDAATGRQVGEVVNAGDTAVLDGGRLLVTHPLRVRRNAACEGYVLGFWDVATGAPLGEWDLGAPADGGGMINSLAWSESDRYLAAEYNPDYGRRRGAARAATDRLATALTGGPPPEPERVLVLDVVRRRELARLPGRSAAFSRDGRWLATLDGAGGVRVWAVPLRPAWARILGYAGAEALVCWVALVLLGRLGRHAGRLLGRLRGGWRRRRWLAGVLACVALAAGAAVWDAVARSRSRAALLAAYEEVQEGMTEGRLTTLFGGPPDEGPVAEMDGRTMGWQMGHPTAVRKWSRHGTEVQVLLGNDGTVRGAYISNPLGLSERVANWLDR
jgi:hypothetical protein